jgi:sterol desaturase/sphingolipid hydroxylase (fatty acid hydroxylase superfamily)
MDLTEVAIPFYFGSMEVERRWLARRAEQVGPSAADYTRPDTAASLAMGLGSLFIPVVSTALAKQVLPGKGRFPKLLVRSAVVAAVATTVADRVARRGERRAAAIAGTVAAIGGPVAIAAGGVALATTAAERLTPKRMWEANGGRDLGPGAAGWLAAVAGWDLVYYWNHRLMHEVRALWAIHVVHHSSERYNLSTALRQPVADMFGVFVPYGLLARAGVRPRLIEHARGINLLYQYWIHTDTIRRVGPAEAVLNTPSHHRVHHGSNPRYIDRNHGSMLIVWDRLFGTFQREEEPVVYGLTKNINTFRPDRIIDHEYVDMIRDVARSTTWRDRLSFVLRGPGWAYRRHAEAASAGSVTTPGTGTPSPPSR